MTGFTSRHHGARSLLFPALTAALALHGPTRAAAVDTEPLNNSQLTPDSLPLSLAGTAVSNLAGLGGESGDVDFFEAPLAAGDVWFGMVTPLAGLPDGFWTPDTIVSVFDGGAARTFSDDDYADELSDFGDGYGSLFRFESPATAVYQVGVSGYSDDGFDGVASGDSHVEIGDYVLTAARVNPAIPGGGFADADPANQTAVGADLIALTSGAARAAVAHLGDGDVDFYRLDLNAGDVLSAMTAPLDSLSASFDYPDTMLGLFDSSGANLLVENDDAGGYGESSLDEDLESDFPRDEGPFGSALRALVPVDGTYYLAVTGYEDDDFVGEHLEFGDYALLVGVSAPEPGGVVLAADFNRDGQVNGTDLAAWSADFNRTGGKPVARGDANHDGAVDGADFLAWQRQLGSAPAVAAQAAVPEPEGLCGAMIAAVAVGPEARSRGTRLRRAG
jgi:hypothetical protein